MSFPEHLRQKKRHTKTNSYTQLTLTNQDTHDNLDEKAEFPNIAVWAKPLIEYTYGGLLSVGVSLSVSVSVFMCIPPCVILGVKEKNVGFLCFFSPYLVGKR